MPDNNFTDPDFSVQHPQLNERHVTSTNEEMSQMRRTAFISSGTVLVLLRVAAISVRPGRFNWIDEADANINNYKEKGTMLLLVETVAFFNGIAAMMLLLWSTVGSDVVKSLRLIKHGMLSLILALCGILVAATFFVQLTVEGVSVHPGQYNLINDINTNNYKELGTMARKAAFAVFLLAKRVTFVNAMVAGVLLLWSTVGSNVDKSMRLIKRGVHLLMTALCGCMVGFTTGVFALYPMSLWPIIAIGVLFSLVGLPALLFKGFSI